MKLGFKEKFAYGIGAVGKDMVYMLSASYILYYYQDMNLTEVAEALHTSTSTVSRRLKHAQDILRNELKGGWEDEWKQYPSESSSGSGPDDVRCEA